MTVWKKCCNILLVIIWGSVNVFPNSLIEIFHVPLWLVMKYFLVSLFLFYQSFSNLAMTISYWPCYYSFLLFFLCSKMLETIVVTASWSPGGDRTSIWGPTGCQATCLGATHLLHVKAKVFHEFSKGKFSYIWWYKFTASWQFHSSYFTIT